MPKTRALAVLVVTVFAGSLCSQTRPRARDLGVPFDGTPGPFNAITDVMSPMLKLVRIPDLR